MALRMLDKETREFTDNGTPRIVIESDITDSTRFGEAIQELKHADARNLALKVSPRFGIPNPRCQMTEPPYPVDEEGQVVSRPLEQTIAGYRVEIPVFSKPT